MGVPLGRLLLGPQALGVAPAPLGRSQLPGLLLRQEDHIRKENICVAHVALRGQWDRPPRSVREMDVLQAAGSEDGLDNPALVICPSQPSTAPRLGELRGDADSRPALSAITRRPGPPGGDSVLVMGAGSEAKPLGFILAATLAGCVTLRGCHRFLLSKDETLLDCC